MKLIKLCVALSAIAFITSCATIAGENTRKVRVSSYPAGAKIMVDNKQYGVTPAEVRLPNYIYGGKSVTLQKKGYQDQTIQVNTKFQPVALFDLLLWPTFLIDGVAGNLVKIDPNQLNLHSNLQVA